MVKLSSTVVLALIAGASAFAPKASTPVRSDVALDMANGSKRKAVMKVSRIFHSENLGRNTKAFLPHT